MPKANVKQRGGTTSKEDPDKETTSSSVGGPTLLAAPGEEAESQTKTIRANTPSLNRRPAKAQPSKEARLQLLLNCHLYRASEETRVIAILNALQQLWGSLEEGPFCFVDLACGEGQIVLQVASNFPSCSAVGWDTEKGDVSRAIGNLKRRGGGLQERCEFYTRSNVGVNLQDATVALMCPLEAGASFILRRVLPKSGLPSSSVVLSLGHPLPTDVVPIPFQLILQSVSEDKPFVFCYTWEMLPVFSKRPHSRSSASSASRISSPLAMSLTSSLPSFPTVADSHSGPETHFLDMKLIASLPTAGSRLIGRPDRSSPLRRKAPYVTAKVAW